MIWYAICLHLVWGLCILADSRTAGVTAIHHVSLVMFRSSAATGLLMLAVAGLAFAGMVIENKMTIVLLLIPQQSVLMLSAVGAVVASFGGHFADGVPRPHAFIFADQTPAILSAILHTVAFLDIYFAKDDA